MTDKVVAKAERVQAKLADLAITLESFATEMAEIVGRLRSLSTDLKDEPPHEHRN